MHLLLLLAACTGSKDNAGVDTSESLDSGDSGDDCPTALVSPEELRWTDLPIGEPAVAAVSVVNNCVGASLLSILAEVDGGPFTVTGSPASLEPGGVATFEVAVTPSAYAPLTATLLLSTNDPAASSIAVPLSATIEADADGDGHDAVGAGGDDCDDTDGAISPSATEIWYDGIDQDCDGRSDDDQDGDGQDAVGAGGDDCDDTDAAVYAEAPDAWYDGVDTNCDGAPDYDADSDTIDAIPWGEDCDDEDAAVYPGAADAWYDGVDQDCDGASDYDADQDTYDAAPWGGDCDDADPAVSPAALEVWYDGVDQDCDAGSDYDADGDGIDAPEGGGADCDDLVATVYPGAPDAWYDGLDANCDGASDYDQDADGHDAVGYGGGDCDDRVPTVFPGAAEIWYDGVDQDCSGGSDLDQDGDGYDAVGAGGDDCNDVDAAVSPAATETWYDGIDQDCDGRSDDDQDGDGVDRFPTGADCADDDASTTAGAAEALNGLDDDCDGSIDEDFITAGALIVTEVLADPAAVSDAYGEWFEVHNTTAYPLDLDGWQFYADDGGSFVVGASLPVAAGGYAVLGVSADAGQNGGVTVDYVYNRGAFALGDDGDSIYIQAGSTAISEVVWSTSWPGVSTSGVAMQLDKDHLDATDGALSSSWCAATDGLSGGDLGTPGTANGNCALDDDGDGATTTDCDDDDASVHPGGAEIDDGVDQNCNGFADDISYTAGSLPYVSGGSSSARLALLGAGEFDGDGGVEVATFLPGTGTWHFLPAEDYRTWAGRVTDYADGSFTTSPMVISPEYSHGTGDINGDGIQDLLMYGAPGGRGGFVGWLGPFTGAMGSRAPDVQQYHSETVGAYSKEVYAGGDLNGDGLDEAVFASPSSEYVSGAWGQVAIYDGATLSGELDNADAATILYGTGGLVFFGAVVDIGDADGDGLDDLAIATAHNSVGSPEPTYVWASDGLSVSAPQDIETVAMVTLQTEGEIDTTDYTSLSLRDVDADGQSDLGYSWQTTAGTSVVWFLDLPGGGPTRADPDVTWARSPYGYAKVDDTAVDIDGDGVLEQGFAMYPDSGADPLYAFLAPGAYADGSIDAGDATWVATFGEPFRWSALAVDLDDDGDTELMPWDADASVGGVAAAGGFQVVELP